MLGKTLPLGAAALALTLTAGHASAAVVGQFVDRRVQAVGVQRRDVDAQTQLTQLVGDAPAGGQARRGREGALEFGQHPRALRRGERVMGVFDPAEHEGVDPGSGEQRGQRAARARRRRASADPRLHHHRACLLGDQRVAQGLGRRRARRHDRDPSAIQLFPHQPSRERPSVGPGDARVRHHASATQRATGRRAVHELTRPTQRPHQRPVTPGRRGRGHHRVDGAGRW